MCISSLTTTTKEERQQQQQHARSGPREPRRSVDAPTSRTASTSSPGRRVRDDRAHVLARLLLDFMRSAPERGGASARAHLHETVVLSYSPVGLTAKNERERAGHDQRCGRGQLQPRCPCSPFFQLNSRCLVSLPSPPPNNFLWPDAFFARQVGPH